MIHIVIGTRAQLFKMIPIMLECEKRGYKWRWIYTAQHKETIKETLDTFNISPPNYTVINWSTEAKTMFKILVWYSRMLVAVTRGSKILGGYTGKNHILLTHGDTLTTWWGALLGKLYGCRVMHVEAGLRSFNLFRPFPEEINRLITFRLADVYACPGEWACNNLKKYKGKKINTHYNTQADVVKFGVEYSHKAKLKLPRTKYVVVTTHRYENIFKKERFLQIVEIIEQIAKEFTVLLIQHPATRGQIDKYNLRVRLERNHQIELLPRLEYLPFIKAVKGAEFVITDGGGNQEELFFLGKPTLLLRDETERQEGLGKNVVLSRFDPKTIENFVRNYRQFEHAAIHIKKSPTELIVSELRDYADS